MDDLHLLYVLVDSNLPTGGFVSSSGLESYEKHGFLTTSSTYSTPHAPSVVGRIPPGRGIVDFARAEVDNYASTTICFVSDAWGAVHSALETTSSATLSEDVEMKEEGEAGAEAEAAQEAVRRLEQIDQFHDASLLSHVARRSSRAQGVAMLTLYSRGLSRPGGFDNPDQTDKEDIAKAIIDKYKRLVRLNTAPGHLATCWGVITAAMGVSLGQQQLYPYPCPRTDPRPCNTPLPLPPRSLPPLLRCPPQRRRAIRLLPAPSLPYQRIDR